MKGLHCYICFCLLVLSDYRCNTSVLLAADKRYFVQDFREIRTSEFEFFRSMSMKIGI